MQEYTEQTRRSTSRRSSTTQGS